MVFQKYWKAEEITETKQTELGLTTILSEFGKEVGRKVKHFGTLFCASGGFIHAFPSSIRFFTESYKAAGKGKEITDA